MRPRLFGAGLGVAASACFVVAYAPLEQSLFNPFDRWNGYLWLEAGSPSSSWPSLY